MHPLHHHRRHHHHAGSLQRHLFISFTATVVVTAVVAGLSVHLGNPEQGWSQELRRAEHFVAHRFADTWDDPGARERLARGFSQDLDIDLVVRSADGGVLDAVGAPCPKPHLVIPVRREGQPLGTVQMCLSRHHQGSWRVLVPFGVAVLILWGASGLIARRLARPLRVVAAAAGELGAGKLATRVHLGPRAYHEAGLLAAVINDMAARIERQLSDQRALLAAVSHELRTPLARMRLLTEIGRVEGPETKRWDALDREIMEIDALVSNLLASSRLDFSHLARKSLRARDVALQALERAGLDPSKLEVEGDPGAIEADPTLLASALANLIDNAQRHAGGLELLRVTARDDKVVFEVEDAGPGLLPGEEERIFEAFYHQEKSPTGGRQSVGLGLSLVRRIAEAHGGSAKARNRPQGGAMVSIELKAAAPKAE